MGRKERAPAQKQEASELLFYEVTMLHNLSCRMEPLLKKDTIVGDALLEAFSVHSRALAHFFYSTDPGPDEVIAEDFFDRDNDWISIRPPKSDLLEMVERRVGREVAHLNYARSEVVPLLKGWDYCRIGTEINEAFAVFIQNVPVQLLGPHCAEFKHQDIVHE